MVYIRKWYSLEELERINELTSERGNVSFKEATASVPDDKSEDLDDAADKRLVLDDFVNLSNWSEDKSWGAVTIDVFWTPVDMKYPTDLNWKWG
jgi:Ca2+-dependent lipid-binding protein